MTTAIAQRVQAAHAHQVQQLTSAAGLSRLRVTGVLQDAAQFYPTAGGAAFLLIKLRPAQGLPYHARVDLGTDAADHMAAEALLPGMCAGALVSVAGTGLQLRTDHGHAVLWVIGAREAVLFSDPIPSTTHV